MYSHISCCDRFFMSHDIWSLSKRIPGVTWLKILEVQAYRVIIYPEYQFLAPMLNKDSYSRPQLAWGWGVVFVM